MSRALCLVLALLPAALFAQVSFLPLREVRAGMKGVGRSVFAGSRIEEFGVEILGVLENAGPKQSIVLARLSGAALDRTGVLQGMSGSPVYVGGRLLGAVALAFPFAKEAICGIRPIGEMVRAGEQAPPRRARALPVPWEYRIEGEAETPAAVFGESRLARIATPVSFTGLTARTLEQFAPALRGLGLEPRQGLTGGGAAGTRMGDPKTLAPGAMISVQLLSGDMSVGADGTVTHIDGNRIYAFGHRFLSAGSTELPFARAEVLALLPSVTASFKISTAREPMGAITEDRSTAVAGELGRRARTVPLEIAVTPRGGAAARYRMQMVSDGFLAPLLVQMAAFSAIDATERAVGSSSLTLRGEIRFQNGVAPVRLDNMFAGDANVPLVAAMGATAPLAFALQSGFDALRLAGVSLEIESSPEKKQVQIDEVWTPRREVRPGERVDLVIGLSGDNGAKQVRRVSYTVPPGAPAGALNFTVADGATTNFTEYRHLLTAPPRSAAQVLSILNGLRTNAKAYVRVWRADAGFQVQGEDLPSAPPSLALILNRGGIQSSGRGSKLAEFEISGPDAVVSGSKTIQVEVKDK
ncbi:MAG: hypothetical protein HY822_04625 [Acidobacteria bacterium]|nr:hypothetical protein [Acidobacteriota bacterium]